MHYATKHFHGRLRRAGALVLAVVMVFCAMTVVVPQAQAAVTKDQINNLKNQASTLSAQKAEIQAELNKLASSKDAALDEKILLEEKINVLRQEITVSEEAIQKYGEMIALKEEELAEAQEKEAQYYDKFCERVRSMEERGDISYWSVLFNASSFSDLLDRVNMVQEIAAADKRRLKELSDAAAVVAEAKAGLEEEKAGLESAREAMVAAQAELEVKQAEATALLDALRARGDEFEALMEEAEARQSEVMLEIAQKEEELEEAEYQEWLATYVPPPDYVGDTTPSSNAPSSSGWVCPVPYYTLSSPFGYRWHPIWGDYRFHYGIDMSLSAGNPIYAAKGGQVVSAGWNDSMGWYVKINHGDGFTSIYMHMTNHIVYYGDYVSAGQVIGFVGSTGDSTGPHLHFGIAYNGTYVNPLEYI